MNTQTIRGVNAHGEPVFFETSNPVTERELSVGLFDHSLSDGDVINLCVKSRRTGQVFSLRLRRQSMIELGNFGASGFWCDVYDPEIKKWRYLTHVTTGAPARSWRIGRIHRGLSSSPLLTIPALWALELLFMQGQKGRADLCRFASIFRKIERIDESNAQAFDRRMDRIYGGSGGNGRAMGAK